MGKNSRQRRDARRRATTRAPRPAARAQRHEQPDDMDEAEAQQRIIALIETAARFAADAPAAAGPRIARLNEIGSVAPAPHLDPAALVVDQVLSRIRAAWEHGW